MIRSESDESLTRLLCDSFLQRVLVLQDSFGQFASMGDGIAAAVDTIDLDPDHWIEGEPG